MWNVRGGAQPARPNETRQTTIAATPRETRENSNKSAPLYGWFECAGSSSAHIAAILRRTPDLSKQRPRRRNRPRRSGRRVAGGSPLATTASRGEAETRGTRKSAAHRSRVLGTNRDARAIGVEATRERPTTRAVARRSIYGVATARSRPRGWPYSRSFAAVSWQRMQLAMRPTSSTCAPSALTVA